MQNCPTERSKTLTRTFGFQDFDSKHERMGKLCLHLSSPDLQNMIPEKKKNWKFL